MQIILEQILNDINDSDIETYLPQDLSYFSKEKNLNNFPYQKEALKNIIKLLYLYFKDNIDGDKKMLAQKYKQYGFVENDFSIKKSDGKRFKLLKNHYDVLEENGVRFISAENFLNRACFWMATGSGKSIVLIKTIEILDYLQTRNVIPKREIMLLLPREDLIIQFKKEIIEFNKDRDRKIELVNLLDYESDSASLSINHSIKVYFYRSDLIRDERKETILDFKSYDNRGKWYVFLDEAHRGEKENSLMQNYISILSRNGFLFNFSATFTEEIDYASTCFNFNLEKFIGQGYGKNLYLSSSYFSFNKEKDELSLRQKQKEVLKSLIIFAALKECKGNAQKGFYHNPLLITLVNSVNTEEADLLLFFNEIARIASGKIDDKVFKEAKDELEAEFAGYKPFVLGAETLIFDICLLKKIDAEILLFNVFNSKKPGKIEIATSRRNEKEIVLKLETSDRAFALIKIGAAKEFQNKKLKDYRTSSHFDDKNIFSEINENSDINLLLGSRSFYEGWDSNRPNVINMINIGGSDAKKFVLQSIGRGARIEPVKGNRKRLPQGDVNKNNLLETLFIFATDKNSIKAVVETMDKQRMQKRSKELSLFVNEKPFALLIPEYKNEEGQAKFKKFHISKESLTRFRKYLCSFEKNLLLLKCGLSLEKLNFLLSSVKANESFLTDGDTKNNYRDMDFLFSKLISHIDTKNKIVEGVKELQDEIIHFKHIEIFDEDEGKIAKLQEKINSVAKSAKKETQEKINRGEIKNIEDFEKAKILLEDKAEFTISNKRTCIQKLSKHYYLPLIYSKDDRIEHISHIIFNKSETDFIEGLENFISENEIEAEWMFSKIDESLDNIKMPYFYTAENTYREFFPDFIFWIKKGSDYRIVFIDPKGTAFADYQNKIDDFEKLFLDKDKNAKVFTAQGFNITFDLRLYNGNPASVGEKYRKYWHNFSDFSFF